MEGKCQRDKIAKKIDKEHGKYIFSRLYNRRLQQKLVSYFQTYFLFLLVTQDYIQRPHLQCVSYDQCYAGRNAMYHYKPGP